MRIGILTFHRAYNCGAMLQAWALKTVLERMGHTVEFPNCNDVGYIPIKRYVDCIPENKHGLSWIRSYIGRKVLDLKGADIGPTRGLSHNKFRKKYLPERDCAENEFIKYYDCLVYGSDQIFSPIHTEKWQSYFLGENAPNNIPKIVYAGSFGDRPLDGDNLIRWQNAMQKMNAVSLRETYKDYPVVADPTLLLEGKDYYPLKANNLWCPKEKYAVLYSCDSNLEYQVSLARKITNQHGIRLVIVPAYPNEWSKKLPETYEAISPDRLVYLIQNASMVFAGSFHGCVFSLHFKKPFINIRNQVDRTDSRPYVLLKRFGLLDHIINPSMDDSIAQQVITTPISNDVYNKLEYFRNDSLSWLSSVLR